MDSGIEALCGLLQGRRLVALTGAGCGTESGIPDYRGEGTARRARNPIRYRDMVDNAAARRRYWARSMAGWPRVARARPNPAHRALAELEKHGALTGIITQNVDGLHYSAGSHRVVELHGTLDEVTCLACGARELRVELQRRLEALNEQWSVDDVSLAPDGDADLLDRQLEGFVVATCRDCGGALKPRVVFFGENVPRATVDAAYAMLEESEALLVVGSSLTVFSGFRFVRRASELGIVVAIVNRGETRGDALAQLRIDAPAGEAVPRLVELLRDTG